MGWKEWRLFVAEDGKEQRPATPAEIEQFQSVKLQTNFSHVPTEDLRVYFAERATYRREHGED